MDFTYDEDQIALRDVARQALEKEATPTVLRAIVDSDDGVGPDLWKRIVELGWHALLIPEAHDGAGAGFLETAIVVEQMGRIPLPGPFFSSAVCATLAARALGLDDLLSDLAGGTHRGTIAVGELGGGNPLLTVKTRARRKGAGWALTGTKPLVLDGHSADWCLVVARTEEGIRTFRIDAPEARQVPVLDPSRRAARIELDDTPAAPVGPPGAQGKLWERIQDDIAVLLVAELVGVADRALAEATEYTSQRIVFDKPVATLQVARHKMVEMFHGLEMARVGAQFAAMTTDADDDERERAVKMAIAYACETAIHSTGENIQLHGGVGFTWANDAHFLYKRAKQNEVLLGGAADARRRVGLMLTAAV